MKKQWREELKNDLLVIVGLLAAAVAYRMYLIPNKVVAWGFTGVGQLVNHLTGISVGVVNIALNVPLFLISMRSMGIRFGVRSLIAMVRHGVANGVLRTTGATPLPGVRIARSAPLSPRIRFMPA